MLDNRSVEPGIVQAERRQDGWIFVQIGRARKVKQIYLSDAEARQLLDKLRTLLHEN